MLGFKLFGAGLLVLSGWWLGRGLCNQEHRRLEQTQSAAALLRFVRSQIDTYLLPMTEILRLCDDKLLCDCGIDAPAHNVQNISEQCRGLLDPATRDTLSDYFRRAGRGDRAAEVALCEGCIRTLDTREQTLLREYSRRCRLIMTLCICASAGVALLLF